MTTPRTRSPNAAPAAPARGFTLLELIIVVALVAIVIVLAAPGFRQMIEMQRLRSHGAQVVTDIQFARSEAASRQRQVYVTFNPGSGAMSCYVIHTCNVDGCMCDCTAAVGSRCSAGQVEVRTVQIDAALGVKVAPRATGLGSSPNVIAFDPVTGGMDVRITDPARGAIPIAGEGWVETSLICASSPPTLRTVVATTGRPSVCSPSGLVSGVPAC